MLPIKAKSGYVRLESRLIGLINGIELFGDIIYKYLTGQAEVIK